MESSKEVLKVRVLPELKNSHILKDFLQVLGGIVQILGGILLL